MKPDRLLYLSAHQMTFCHWQAGTLTHRQEFPATEAGYQQFADCLAQHQGGVFALLVNVAEEGFQVETLPSLHGAERRSVVTRKLQQRFFGALLTATLSLGHKKTRRKDEQVMLAALTGEEHIAPWLKIMDTAGIALSGIYSLPFLSTALLRRIRIREAQYLLLTVQDQSIRQSYFADGELHFSRLAPLADTRADGLARAFATETQKLQQYLTSQRLLPHNQAITVCLLAHQNAGEAIQNHCVSTDSLRYIVLDIEKCARKTGLETTPVDSHCEPLFLHLLRTTPPRIQFATDGQRHNFHLRQMRFALHLIGALFLAGSLLASALFLAEAATRAEERARLQEETREYQQSYGEIVKNFPPLPVSNDGLRRIIDRHAELEKRNISPAGLYREISRALEQIPAAELESIDWKADGIGLPTQTTTSGDKETALVHGTLTPGSKSSPRQMLAVFSLFIDTLKANPELQVEVLQRPFDIAPGQSLNGDDTQLDDSRPRPFSLRIARKITS